MKWGQVAFANLELPQRTPVDSGALVSVLDDPSAARFVYHPVERTTDPSGWASERLLFFGVDGRWRSLDMADLGLSETWWPGPDTYGAGELSADGRTWAAHTNAGVLFMDLAQGTFRHVALPKPRSVVRFLSWVPGTHVVSASARTPQGHVTRTFHVHPDGRIKPVPYDGWLTRYDVDGTPVEIRRSGARELTVTRWTHGTTEPATTWELPVKVRSGDQVWGSVFSKSRVAMYGPGQRRAYWGPTMIWIFNKGTGEAQARLSISPRTSIEGWVDDHTLLILVNSRHLIAWEPETQRVRRLMELPGPYPAKREWAAATVALPG